MGVAAVWRFLQGVEVVELKDSERSNDQYPLICEFCGRVIDHLGKRCAALEDGRCRP